MEPKKLTDDERAMYEELAQTHDAIHPGQLLAHIAAMESEHRAMVADNAALLQAMLDVADMRLSGPTLVAMASKLRSELHPGAALLSEMEALKRERDEARTHADALKLRVGRQETLAEARRITISTMEKEAATARAAALEEAAEEARRWNGEAAKRRIRALATTPPPPVVPVAKVQEVLRGIYETSKRIRDGLAQRDMRHAEHSGRMGASFAAARDLGINLDGEP